jgi:hypothetical protein
MSDEQESLLQQANKHAHDMLLRRLARPITDAIPAQGEKMGIPALPEPAKQDDLTEVCQLCGKALYVRLDWRDPGQAKHELDRIRFTIKDAFSRAYGWFEEPPKERLVQAHRDANTKAGEP